MSDPHIGGSDASRSPETGETVGSPEESRAVPPPPPAPPVAPTSPAVPPQAAEVPPQAASVPSQTAASPPNAAISPQLKKHLLSGLSATGIAVGGAFVAGVVLALFVVLNAAHALQGASLPVDTDAFAGFGSFLMLAFSFAAFVFGGELNLQVSSAFGGFGGGAGGYVWVFPLTLTVAALVLVLWWSIRQERTSPLSGIRQRLLFSGAVGLAASVVLLILAAIFTIRQGADAVEIAIGGASYRVVLFGTIFIAGTVFLGRVIGARAAPGVGWCRAITDGIAALPRPAREALQYAAGLTIVFGLITLILGPILLWDGLGIGAVVLVILGLLNFTGVPVVLGHLGGLSVSAGFGGYGGGESTGTIFNIGGWSWLLLVVTLLFSVLIAVRIGTRRGRSAGLNLAEAWKFPVIVLGAWVLHGIFTFGLTVQAGGSVGGFGAGGTAGFAMALWTPLVFLVWAVAIELGAQYLPAVAYALSPRLHGFLAGRHAVQTWVAGTTPAAVAPAAFAGGHTITSSADGAPVDPESGAAQPTLQSQPPVAPPRPLSPGAKKGILWTAISVGAVLVLGIIGAVAVSFVNSTRTADAVALTYLGHIEDGNASAANALVDPDVPNAARTHLTDEVLKSATERISDVSVRSNTSGGDETYLEVSFKLDGVTQHGSLTARKGEPEWLLLDTWEIVTPLVQSVSVDVDGHGSLAIGGVPLPLDGDDSSYQSAEAVLYPGVYEVETDGSALFELDATQLLVGAEQAQSVYLQFAPTDQLVSEVQEQVRTLLDTCAESTAARPDGCPLRTYVYPSDTAVSWSIVAYPTVEVSADGTSFYASEGEATASYTETFFGTSRDSTDELSVSFYGEIEISGDEVTVVYEY